MNIHFISIGGSVMHQLAIALKRKGYQGTIVADGSFASLQLQQGNKSLEQIFASLTAKDSISQAADDLMKAFGKNS